MPEIQRSDRTASARHAQRRLSGSSRPEKLQQNGATERRQGANSTTDRNKLPFMRVFKSVRESPLKL